MYNHLKAEELIIKSQLKQITIEESAELQEILAQYPEAQILKEDIAKDFQLGKLSVNTGSKSELWETLSGTVERKGTKRIVYRKAALAASLILIAGIAALLYNQTAKNTSVEKDQAVAALPKGVHLQLANGQKIALTGDTANKTINTGKSILTTTSNSLTFSAQPNASGEWNTLDVPNMMDYKITLADGTLVRLNSNTRLKFPFAFSEKLREVYVEGEAYFTVAAKTDQPFIVHTISGSDVQVLGTEFNINTYSDQELTTSLVKGAVAVTNGKERITLKPGTQAVIKEHNKAVVKVFDDKSTLSWLKGVYFFHNAPLSQVASVIQRWYNVKVVIDNQQLANKLFTSYLDKSKDLNLFLEVITNTTGAYTYYVGNVLHIATK